MFLGTHLLIWVVFVPVLRAAIVVPEQLPQIECAFLFVLSPRGAAGVICESMTACGYFEDHIVLVYERVLIFFLGAGVFNFFSLLLGPMETP